MDTNGQNVTWATPLTSIGGSLTKLGAGMLTLTASNTYTGNTIVSGGTLQLGTGASGQDGSIATTGSFVNNGALVYNLSGNQTPTYAISGSGNLTKTGTGVLTLSMVNSYGGSTAVTGGILRLQAPAAPVGGSAMWLNAAQGFTVSGNTTTWADQSGNGNSAVNTAGTGPTLLANAINGLSAVKFNASNQYLAGGLGASNSATTSLTVFIVHQDAAFSSLAAYLDTPGWGTGSIGIMQGGTGAKYLQYSVHDYTVTDHQATNQMNTTSACVRRNCGQQRYGEFLRERQCRWKLFAANGRKQEPKRVRPRCVA